MPIELIDNINNLLGDSLKRSIAPGMKLKIAASCFSIYAFEALKTELEKVDSFEFIHFPDLHPRRSHGFRQEGPSRVFHSQGRTRARLLRKRV